MFGLNLDRTLPESLTKQLCDSLRDLIKTGDLQVGEKLPPTRKLSEDLSIARNIVIEAYEQLAAEGYLIPKAGSGTFVANGATDANNHYHIDPPQYSFPHLLSAKQHDVIDFISGIPDLDSFPVKTWIKCYKNALESASPSAISYGHLNGDPELRQQLKNYLFKVKGISCSDDQILIVSGASEGFDLIAKVFRQLELQKCDQLNLRRSPFSSVPIHFNNGDNQPNIYLEDPTVDFVQHIYRNAGYIINTVPVDQNGINIDEYSALIKNSLIVITPAHQFPTGSILSIQRRYKLLRLVHESQSYIIEDDYDSEFRLTGVPVPPIYQLDPDRVIYVGTFSKILSPNLHIGFLVVPQSLKQSFMETKETLNIYTNRIEQKALSEFIKNGFLERHIYNMKILYRKKRSYLVKQIHYHFGDNVGIYGDSVGMHIQVVFQKLEYSTIDWNKSVDYGVKVYPFSDFCISKHNSNHCLVLGYGHLSDKEIHSGVERLKQFVNDFI